MKLYSRLGVFVLLMPFTGCLEDDGGPPAESFATSENSGEALFAAEGWTISIIDSGLTAGQVSSLAYDAQSNPAVCFVSWDTGDVYLKLARWSGGNWIVEDVFMTPGPYGVIGPFSLAFDPSGKPAVAFVTTAPVFNGATSLRFAEKKSSSWSIKTVQDSQVSHSAGSLLVYDSSGRPSVAYGETGNPAKIRFAWRSGSTWKKEIVESGGNSPSLARDTAGNLGIAYYAGGSLKFARRSGSAWTKTLVETTATAFSPWLAFNPLTGHPAIVHGSLNFYPTLAVRYVSWNGSAWSGENVVDPTGETQVFGASLAFQANGEPVVGCLSRHRDDATVRSIQSLRRLSDAWVMDTVETGVGAGNNFGSYVRVGANGATDLAYRGNGAFKFARRDSP